MAAITLADIRLHDYSLDNLPRLARLRKASLEAKPEVCIERALHLTRYFRDEGKPDDPPEITRARAVKHFLEQKKPLFFDNSLLAGTTTSKPFGAPVYPELTGLTIWPELDVIGTRDKNPQKLSKKEAEVLNTEVFPYWLDRTVLERARQKFGNPTCMQFFERIVFFLASKAGCISHTVPCYRRALEIGLEGIIAEAEAKERKVTPSAGAEAQKQVSFYRAMQIALEGIIAYGANLSREAAQLAATEPDAEHRGNLLQMAEVCARVPAKPARTFREAVNSVWLLQVAVHAENINMAISPGRLDQILYPYFRRDLDNGTLTLKDAMELVGCLWLKLNDNTNLVPETAEELFGGAGTVPAVTIGGVDAQGEDAVNDLTYIMLRVTELLRTRDPSVNARYHYQKNPAAYRDRVAEVIANTRSVPAFHNDVVDIRVMEKHGVAIEHARDYAIIGCVELATAGRSYDASSSIMFNLVSALELALYNGRRPVTGDEQIGPRTGDAAQFQTFDEFRKAFHGQLCFLIGEAIRMNEMLGAVHQEMLPTPLLSALFEGPMEKGRDLIFGGALYNSSGATHIGFADTVDSLNAIEKAVFVDRVCTFDELLRALRADFNGCEKLHAYLVNKSPKYGTDDPIAKRNAQDLIRFLHEIYQGHVNYRGGRYRPAYWTMTNHAGQGKLSGALPNGRRAYRVFASGITPGSQAAPDLAACLAAVGGLDGDRIPGGEAFNLKYSAMETADDLARFSSAVEAYMRGGGLHIQFNIMSYQDLLKARKNPEQFPELLVRVSGYSAYFKDLNAAMREEIVTRTAYNLRTGKAESFPPDQSDILPFAG